MARRSSGQHARSLVLVERPAIQHGRSSGGLQNLHRAIISSVVLVAAGRLARVVSLVAAAGADPTTPGPFCQVAVGLTQVTGAGVMIIAGDDTPQATFCTTGSASALIEELQYTFGEGPCIDAHRIGAVVAEPNLASPSVPRWPAFTPKVIAAGVRAIFGFPIRIGAARVGALNLYRDEAGSLSDDQHADALVIADVIAQTLLTVQASATFGSLPAQLDADLHSAVHQAAGMVSVQLGVSVGEALVRLRAYAFATDRPLTEVAHDVIDRVLTFDDLGES